MGFWIRVLLPVTALPLLFVLGKGDDAIGYFGLILLAIQIVCLLAPIFPTERALKRTFDENGSYKK